VVADHGEAFGDGGEATHGLLLRGATLDIPFVLAAPGALPEGRRVEGTVTSADLTPTVLDLVGAPVPSGLDGRSLLAEIGGSTSGGRPVYSETRLPLDQYGWSMLSGFRDDRWAWVRAPRPELYDLDADPGETTNLAGTLPDVEARLDELVEAVLAGEPARETRRRPSADELEKLHALGYVLSSDAPEATGADPKDMLEVWNGIVEIRERARGGLQESDIVREATRLLAMDPGNEELRLMRGQALVGAGRAEEGLEELAALHAENPGPGRIGAFRSRALSDAGRFAQAAELLRELAEAEPLVEDHPYHLGLTLREMGRAAEAREAFEAAHRLNPDAVHVLANLSVELSRVPGEEARAATLAERAVALAPGDDRARENLARVLGNTGRTAEAMAEVRALSAKRRLSGVSRKELADLMRELEHPAQPLGNGGQSE
ncbi:MAG: hypothetical protein QGH59_05595, partial [Gemmatimonadota bacterium]|jgi:Flp pilus assembly protein TadD|nr:hypothetical protein [Gemmatimonadota bacterium]